ncbi:putative integrase domain protein [Orientia tsutsugamushi str. UT76]|nr:putative integrase domain protein [Orientia tsutsugamushi str. UT76]
MAKGIDPREVKRQQQIAEDEKTSKARQEITFQELYYRYSNNVGNRYNQINFITCSTAMLISLN